jgi:UDP-N-acetylmuramoylalanine--D-glutamate ligase
MNVKDKNIVIVGLGRTGVALARFLARSQASVVITDTADESALENQLEMIRELEIKTELGKHRSETFTKADLIVISPGVPHTIEPVKKARDRGVPVIGEIELASRFIETPIVAVTGTNGKTTTTELIGAMLQSSGRKVFVGGNIGNPLISYADSHDAVDVVVAEISSFQLDTIEKFRPWVSVLLNISSDHLDRYPDMAAYIESKGRIFNNQRLEDIAVLNGSDPRVRGLSANIKCKKLLYPAPLENEAGAMLSGDSIELITKNTDIFDHLKLNGTQVKAASRGLMGKHNQENVCAAMLAALASGATLEGVRKALDQYQGSAHRLEHVATINHIEFFNDSKATNVDAVDRALECFQQPVVLIMGGRDKGSNFAILQNRIQKHTKTLIVMGEAADHIRKALRRISSVISASSMQDAVSKAYQAAAPGDVVLLSPGCASFDMYVNYGQRGDDFRRAVQSLN